MLPLIGAILCIVTGALAARKGYNFFLWVLAGGIVGLLILAFLPFVAPALTPGVTRGPASMQDDSRRRTGNIIGAVLSALAVAFVVIQLSRR